MDEELQKQLDKARETLKVDDDVNSESSVEEAEETKEVEDSPEKNKGVVLDLSIYEKFVQLPFSTFAKLTGCSDLALTKEEIESLGSSIKPLGDKYLPVWFEKHGEMLLFCFTLTSVTLNKLVVYSEYKKKNKKETDEEVKESPAEKEGSAPAGTQSQN